MSLEIKSYMGRFGFAMRKYMPFITGQAYLTLQKIIQYTAIYRYIRSYNPDEKRMPVCVSIETVNRCNGECAFCPANRHSDKRKLQIMDENLFRKIIDELHNADYNGNLLLMNNNEPFLDPDFNLRLEYAAKQLKKAKIFIYTNGTLLTPEKLAAIPGNAHKVIVSNYSEKYKLSESSKKIADEVSAHPERYENLDVLIEYRYSKEVLSNRGGTSPNKKRGKERKYPCMMPFTDLVVYPDGRTGICCCDFFGKINIGNAADENIIDIFNGKKVKKIRTEVIKNGKPGEEVCKYCDFIGRKDTRFVSITNKSDVYFGR